MNQGELEQSAVLNADDLIEQPYEPAAWPFEMNSARHGSAISMVEARAMVTEIFELILKRAPDEPALNAFSSALERGLLDSISIVRELINSDEYTLSLVDGGASSAPSVERARETVMEMFQIVFKRDPDDQSLNAFSVALESGTLTPVGMMRELMSSEEFATSALRAAPVARYLAAVVIRTLMARDAGDDAIEGYAGALEGRSYSLSDFLQELLNSAEFGKRMKRPEKLVISETKIPLELGLLAESLIVARLTAEGCNIAAPSLDATNWPITAENQMRSMLYTLDMLAGSVKRDVVSGEELPAI